MALNRKNKVLFFSCVVLFYVHVFMPFYAAFTVKQISCS